MKKNDPKWLTKGVPIRIGYVVAFSLLSIFLFSTQELSAKNVIVTDYGAVGDGSTLTTKALQSAIEACAKSGGGEVLVPPGKCITGTIWLSGHVELRLSYDDIQQFNPGVPVKLGYYMNLQFASTGSHLAPGKGPWKMDFNYRYVNSMPSLYLSVVNSGNFREFLYTISANAKMLWDYDTAYSEMEAARGVLYASEHGAFDTWYAPDRIFGLNATLETIDKARIEAAKR